MPFALVIIGLILIITGVRDTYAQLGAQLRADFTGNQNFTVWILAIGAVGALGYVDRLRTFSHMFLALIIIAMVLSNQKQGLIARFMDQWNKGPVIAPGSGSGLQSPTSTLPAPSGTNQPPSFLQSFKKPGGGGFWDWSGIPSPF